MTKYSVKIKNTLNEVTIYTTSATTKEDAERRATLAYQFGGNSAEIVEITSREI